MMGVCTNILPIKNILRSICAYRIYDCLYLAMRIDPKYFNVFVVTVGITAVIAVIFFNLRYAENQRTQFIENVGDGRDVYNTWLPNLDASDSVSAAQFLDKYVVIHFWSTWSSQSTNEHEALWKAIEPHKDKVQVIAAGVKDNEELTKVYADSLNYNYLFVNGSNLFYELLAPGIPTQIIFAPGGELIDIKIGFRPQNSDDFIKHILK